MFLPGLALRAKGWTFKPGHKPSKPWAKPKLWLWAGAYNWKMLEWQQVYKGGDTIILTISYMEYTVWIWYQTKHEDR